MIEELIMRVFCARDVTHLAHWRTKSYAEHVALGEFYGGVIDILDRLVESHQGAFGVIGETDYKRPEKKAPLAYLKSEVAWIAKNREKISQDVSSLENIVDELTGLFLRTIYKLENLK